MKPFSGTQSKAIQVVSLSKHYNGLKAVDSVNLEIEKGTVFGLLGPNGAGKTTLISMLVTMRKPTSGTAKVNGFDIKKEADSVRKSIGVVFQDPSLDDELTAMENLELHAALYNVPRSERKKRIQELLRLVGLEESIKMQVKKFSGGMKRRLEIARGLVHHPQILFLDEPTLGLDPQTRAGIWDYIKQLNEREGITIILTTHYLEEADSVCKKIAIIDFGKIIAMGSPEELKNSLGGDTLSIKCVLQENCKEKLAALGWVKAVVEHDGFLNLRVEKGEEKIPKLLAFLEKNGVIVESVSLRKPSLDDVFLHFTGRTIREQKAKPIDSMRLRRKFMRR
ncbi:MAG: ATP-binding cassette domain-containing protein [Candidatus Diapherotrites archaeon]